MKIQVPPSLCTLCRRPLDPIERFTIYEPAEGFFQVSMAAADQSAGHYGCVKKLVEKLRVKAKAVRRSRRQKA